MRCWLEMLGWRRRQRGWFGPILVRLCSPAALAIFVPRSTASWGCWIFWSLCDQISSSSTLLAFSNESHTLSSCVWGFCSSNLCKLNLAILIGVMLPLSYAMSSPVLSFLVLILANVGLVVVTTWWRWWLLFLNLSVSMLQSTATKYSLGMAAKFYFISLRYCCCVSAGTDWVIRTNFSKGWWRMECT